MHSFLLISTDKAFKSSEIERILQPYNIASVDKTVILEEGSIGIETVRKVKQTLFLKPFSSTSKALIIENMHTATTDAQNALLKVLEEPPDHTFIILTGNSLEQILPTIQSRCTIITFKEKTKEISSKERTAVETFFTDLDSAPIGERLARAQSISKTREDAIAFISSALILKRENLLTQIKENKATKKSRLLLENLQESYGLLVSTNANPRMIIENCFRSFS